MDARAKRVADESRDYAPARRLNAAERGRGDPCFPHRTPQGGFIVNAPSDVPTPRARRWRRIVWLALVVLVAAGLWRTDARWLPPIRSRVVALARHEGFVPPPAITRTVSGPPIAGGISFSMGRWPHLQPYFGVSVPRPTWLATGASLGVPWLYPAAPWMNSGPFRYAWDAYTLQVADTPSRSPIPGLTLNPDFFYELFIQPGTLNTVLAEVVNDCPGVAQAHPHRVPTGCTLTPYAASSRVFWELGSPPWLFFGVHDGWVVSLSFTDSGLPPVLQRLLAAQMLTSYFAQPGWHRPPGLPPTSQQP